jgi:hypothetical protein
MPTITSLSNTNNKLDRTPLGIGSSCAVISGEVELFMGGDSRCRLTLRHLEKRERETSLISISRDPHHSKNSSSHNSRTFPDRTSVTTKPNDNDAIHHHGRRKERAHWSHRWREQGTRMNHTYPFTLIPHLAQKEESMSPNPAKYILKKKKKARLTSWRIFISRAYSRD